jgi:hypothetical protein
MTPVKYWDLDRFCRFYVQHVLPFENAVPFYKEIICNIIQLVTLR